MRHGVTARTPDSADPTSARRAPPNGARILPFPAQGPRPPRAPAALTARERDRLNRLRGLAIESRLFPREDFWNGCARLLGAAHPCPRAVAALFFRSSAEALRTRLEFYRPEAGAVSTDERWLLALLDAIERDDIGNVRALTAFRVHRRHRRAFAALASTFAVALAALSSSGSEPMSRQTRSQGA